MTRGSLVDLRLSSRLSLLGLRSLDSGRPWPLSLTVSRSLSLLSLVGLLDFLGELGQLFGQMMVRMKHWVRDWFESCDGGGRGWLRWGGAEAACPGPCDLFFSHGCHGVCADQLMGIATVFSTGTHLEVEEVMADSYFPVFGVPVETLGPWAPWREASLMMLLVGPDTIHDLLHGVHAGARGVCKI